MDDFVEKALKAIFPESDGIEIFCAYGDGESHGAFPAGLDEVRERRAKGDLIKAVLIYGFDPEDRIRKHEGGSILDAPGVFYLKLPTFLSNIEATVEKAVHAEIPTGGAIDEKSFRSYAVKKVRAFKHLLDNVCASMEMNANRARRELEHSPGVMPVAILEIKSSNIQNLLREYKKHEDLVLRLGISNGDKLQRKMNDFLDATQQIEDKTNAPWKALDLAFRSVELGRAISTILEQAKEL